MSSRSASSDRPRRATFARRRSRAVSVFVPRCCVSRRSNRGGDQHMSRRLLALISTLALMLTSAPATAVVTITHGPRVGNDDPSAVVSNAGWSSSNWSGYAITGNFTAATGSWTVQTAGQSRKPTYSSQWIGIDGFNNSNLIQTGTESDYYSGSAHYAAWWEILPAPETGIPSPPVRPRDH